MKKKLFTCALALSMIWSLTACGSTSDKNDDKSQDQSHDSLSTSSSEVSSLGQSGSGEDISQQGAGREETTGAIESGTYTLPCGMKIIFNNSVRNDVTGNWRLSTTSDSFVPEDYALEYYQQMFASDSEIHAIWNATLGTTTRISVSFGTLYIDTLEYVKGEEHDAKIMFSGDVLDSRMIDIETGELVK